MLINAEMAAYILSITKTQANDLMCAVVLLCVQLFPIETGSHSYEPWSHTPINIQVTLGLFHSSLGLCACVGQFCVCVHMLTAPVWGVWSWF